MGLYYVVKYPTALHRDVNILCLSQPTIPQKVHMTQPQVALILSSSSAQIDNRDEFQDRLAMIAYFRCQYDYSSTWFIYHIHQYVDIADCSSCRWCTSPLCSGSGNAIT